MSSVSEEIRHKLRAKVFDKGSIIFPKIGAAIATNKKRKLVQPSCVDNNVMVLVPSRKLTSDYLYYLLTNKDLSDFANTGNPPSIRKTTVAAWEISLPPLAEQQRIAAVLAKADRLRQLRRYALQLSDTYLQSVFLQMFGDHLQSDYPSTPMGKLVTITGGGTPSRKIREYYTGKIPWLTSKDMIGEYISDTQEHVTEEAIQESATKLVPEDSILIVVKSKVLMRRLPLAITKVELCHGQDIKSIQCGENVEPLFLMYVLKYNEPNLLRQARGVNTEGLTLPMLREVAVPNVPIEMQRKFSCIVQRFGRLQTQQREAARQADHLFDTLLHRAFCGES